MRGEKSTTINHHHHQPDEHGVGQQMDVLLVLLDERIESGDFFGHCVDEDRRPGR